MKESGRRVGPAARDRTPSYGYDLSTEAGRRAQQFRRQQGTPETGIRATDRSYQRPAAQPASAIRVPTPDPPSSPEEPFSPLTAAKRKKHNKRITKMTKAEKAEAERAAAKRAEKKAAKERTRKRRKAPTPPPPSPPPKKMSAAAAKRGTAKKVTKSTTADTSKAANKAPAKVLSKAPTKAKSSTKSAATVSAGTKTKGGRVTKTTKDCLSKDEEKNIKKHLNALNALVKRMRDDDEGAFAGLIGDLADFGERFRAVQRGEFVRERVEESEEEGPWDEEEEIEEEEPPIPAVRGKELKPKALPEAGEDEVDED
jgi:hypothetical protein